MSDTETLRSSLAELRRPFPSASISFRPAVNKPSAKGFARVLSYIDATDVRRRLNAVDPEWSFSIDSDAHWRHGIVEVRGTLTMFGHSRSDYGAAEVNKPRSFSGDPQEVDFHAVKAAASDCFKRCANQFGVGDYLRDMGQFFTDKLDIYNEYIQGINKDGVSELRAKYDRIVSHERFIARYGEVSQWA